MEWIFSHPESTSEGGQSLGGGVEAPQANPPSGGPDKMEVSDGSPSSATEEKPSEVVVHNALCDQCKEQICGIRYKCKVCADYDLCPACYEMRLVYHDPDHEFAAHEKDIPMPEKPPLTEEEKKQALERLMIRREELKKKERRRRS